MNPRQEVRTRQMAHSSKDPNDPPVPWCSVLSVGAHLLVLSSLLRASVQSHLPLPVPSAALFSVLHLPGFPSPQVSIQSHLPDPSPDLTALGPLPFSTAPSPPTLLQDTSVYLFV